MLALPAMMSKTSRVWFGLIEVMEGGHWSENGSGKEEEGRQEQEGGDGHVSRFDTARAYER